jgi:hypothetical protein
MPQVVVNKTKCMEKIEGLESSREPAKHALSQLSCTPTVAQWEYIEFKAFAPVRKLTIAAGAAVVIPSEAPVPFAGPQPKARGNLPDAARS